MVTCRGVPFPPAYLQEIFSFRGVIMTIRGGYYIKSRCIKDSAIAHAPPYVREIWDYLLRNANHADTKYNGFIIKRGQLFRTYREIRDDLHWKVGYRKERYNENQMKMGMRYLMKQLMITLSKQPRGNIITICNYDFYQDQKNYDTTDDTTHDTTNAQPTCNQLVPSINNNVKHIIKDSIIHIPEKGEKAQRSGIKKDTPFILPEWIPEETWRAYLEVRNKKRAAKTSYALNLVIKELIKIRDKHGHDPIDVLNTSIKSGWADVYPLKEEGNNGRKREYRWDGTGDAPKDTKFKVLSGEIASEPDNTATTSIHPGGGKSFIA